MSFWKKLPGAKESPKTIHEAAKEGDLRTVKALLKDNPDLVSSKDIADNLPLHVAARYGHQDVAKLLLANKANVNAKHICGGTPLHVAAEEGQRGMVELLLANGTDVNVKDKYGTTPLHWAAKGGHQDVAELMLAEGADVNAKGKDGTTPLHVAAKKGHKGVAELLLAKGADVNARDEDGKTLLHMSSYDQKDVAELLLAKGADVNARDKYGKTPLHSAAGLRGVTELLLANGADVNAKDKSGKTPLQTAEDNGHHHVTGLLRQHGGRDLVVEIQDAIRDGDQGKVKALLNDNPNLVLSSLSRFIRDNDAKGVRMLIGAGATVDSRAIEMAEVAVKQARAERARLLQSAEPNYMLLPAERAAVKGETVAGAETCLALLKAKVEGEIVATVRAAIAEMGSPTRKGFGKVMKNTMSRFAGVGVDGKLVSEIVNRELSQSECSASFANPQANSEISAVPTLSCAGCGKVYRIGDDAVAVTLEHGLSLARGGVIISDGSTAVREDLVASVDVSLGNLAGAREKARQNWKIIQDSLSQEHHRSWRCKACDKVNEYPMNYKGQYKQTPDLLRQHGGHE